MEIERKFLVNTIPELNNILYVDIQQDYLSLNPEVRLRRTYSISQVNFYLTVKSEGNLFREEFETEISDTTYLDLKRRSICSLSKTRYFIPLGRLIAELDIYLDGLQIVEVEFASIEDGLVFTPPDWFGQEITDMPEYKNKNLAKAPLEV